MRGNLVKYQGKTIVIEEIYASQVRAGEIYPAEDLSPIEATDEWFESIGLNEEQIGQIRMWENSILYNLGGEREKYVHKLQNLHLAITGRRFLTGKYEK